MLYICNVCYIYKYMWCYISLSVSIWWGFWLFPRRTLNLFCVDRTTIQGNYWNEHIEIISHFRNVHDIGTNMIFWFFHEFVFPTPRLPVFSLFISIPPLPPLPTSSSPTLLFCLSLSQITCLFACMRTQGQITSMCVYINILYSSLPKKSAIMNYSSYVWKSIYRVFLRIWRWITYSM